MKQLHPQDKEVKKTVLTKTALGPMDLVLAIGSLVALPTVFAVSRAVEERKSAAGYSI
jgi:hypothetical protein